MRSRNIFLACLLTCSELFAPTCPAVVGADLQEVEKLLPASGELRECKIQARQVVVTLQNNSEAIARAFATHKEKAPSLDVAKLLEDAAARQSSESNTSVLVYFFLNSFTEMAVDISGLPPRTGQVREQILRHGEEVSVLRHFDDVNQSTNVVARVGERFLVPGKSVYGVPHHVSRSLLAEWVRQNAKNVKVEGGRSTRGLECTVIEVAGASNSFVSKHRLHVPHANSNEIEIHACRADGGVISVTEVSFDAQSGFCRRAETRIFSGTNISQQIFWESLNVETNVGRLDFPQAAAFFPEDTLVLDQRFEKPVKYVSGVRDASREEILAMIRSPRAVVDYEFRTRTAAQKSRPEGAVASPASSSGMRFAVLTVFVLISVAFGFFLWRNSRRSV